MTVSCHDLYKIRKKKEIKHKICFFLLLDRRHNKDLKVRFFFLLANINRSHRKRTEWQVSYFLIYKKPWVS
jgi:hypothetical protein